jgi:hypothetical protein
MLENLRVLQKFDDCRPSLPPSITFKVIASSDDVSRSSHGAKATSYVAAIRLTIAEDNAVPENAVVLLLDLG